MLAYDQFDLWELISVNFASKTKTKTKSIVIQENEFENIVYKMSVILYGLRYVEITELISDKMDNIHHNLHVKLYFSRLQIGRTLIPFVI